MSIDTQQPPTTAAPPVSPRLWRPTLANGRQFALTLVALALFVFFTLFARYFLTASNLFDIARATTFTFMVAVGLTYLFVAAELDLSVGANQSFSGALMAIAITNHGVNVWWAAVIAILAGSLIGAINGAVVTIIGVPSFIVTLGMLSLLGGAALVLTGGLPITLPQGLHSTFFGVANGTIGTVPVQILWGLAAFVVGACILKFTPFGYHVYAVGGNAKAARQMGISVKRVKFLCFVLTGFLCGLTGALQVGWLLEADPSSGDTFTLQAIAAVILGGVALYGGAGSVYGTLIGALIIGMLGNALVLIGLQANWPQLFIGLIIIIVAGIEIGIKRSGELQNTRLMRILSRS
jgi:ribose transport system permease protein